MDRPCDAVFEEEDPEVEGIPAEMIRAKRMTDGHEF